jgi:hypothetical protein
VLPGAGVVTVNGRPVTRMVLQDGDVIGVSGVELRFERVSG